MLTLPRPRGRRRRHRQHPPQIWSAPRVSVSHPSKGVTPRACRCHWNSHCHCPLPICRRRCPSSSTSNSARAHVSPDELHARGPQLAGRVEDDVA
ncbi:unnamed protein product [Blumeria hordei]|uniref:Uncharacterized protein n=1 Tax=Blumeria hordei TaxID=2867405 RepID=A0A383V1Q0_BLUHO|nr:unnamed protein product [Blumeria hordei]